MERLTPLDVVMIKRVKKALYCTRIRMSEQSLLGDNETYSLDIEQTFGTILTRFCTQPGVRGLQTDLLK